MMIFSRLNPAHVTRFLSTLALTAMVIGVAPRPAVADGAASTRNIILGAAAVAAGIVIYNNVHHKNLAHDTVVGYTRNGGTIYADGRIVYPNGNVLYTSNGNGRPCAYSPAYGQPCRGNAVAYYPRGHGHAYGHYKSRDRDDNHDRDDHHKDRDHEGDDGHGDKG